jgi:hypothetical protein
MHSEVVYRWNSNLKPANFAHNLQIIPLGGLAWGAGLLPDYANVLERWLLLIARV